MRVYFLEINDKPLMTSCVTNVDNIKKLVHHMRGNDVTNIVIDMSVDKWNEGFGNVSFDDDGENITWNISSFFVYDYPINK